MIKELDDERARYYYIKYSDISRLVKSKSLVLAEAYIEKNLSKTKEHVLSRSATDAEINMITTMGLECIDLY